jgi:hypothetical protein
MTRSKTNSINTKEKKVTDLKARYHAEIIKTVEFFARIGLTITYREELNFHGKSRFDYYIPELHLAVEFEGGNAWGGHTRHNRYRSDLDKYNNAVIEGFPNVLRFIEDTLPEVVTQIYNYYQRRSKRKGGRLVCPFVRDLDLTWKG